MKLLYLYIEDYGCIKNQEFNFDSEIQFHYDWENTHNFSIVSQGLLPNNFWGEGSVKSVSAIVGNNGAGKTSIGRFVANLCEKQFSHNNHFIYLFSCIDQIICLYNLGEGKDKINLKGDVYSSVYNCYSYRIIFSRETIPENEYFYKDYEEYIQRYTTNFVYYSNHFSPAHYGFCTKIC